MVLIDLTCNALNCSSTFSYYLLIITNNVTGSLWLSLLGLFLILYIIGLMAGMPNEITLITLLPLAFIGSLYTANWFVFIGAIAFYVAFLIVKNLW